MSPPSLGGQTGGLRIGRLGRRERLGHLAVVPVDGHRLYPQPPGVDVQLLDVLDRDVLGHVDRLGDGPADEGLHRAHHADVSRVVDGVVAHGAGEHARCSGATCGAPMIDMCSLMYMTISAT